MLLSSSSVNVPAAFVGMQSIKTPWPAGFEYGTARNWDYLGGVAYPGTMVRHVNPAPGVFDWGSFDLFFKSHAGKDKILTLGQPADWMIVRAAVGGANLGGKANMCPSGATEIANFVQAVEAMAARARNLFGALGIKWELWNEIEGPGMYSDVQSSLGPYARAVSQAIKRIDPDAVILSPSARDDDTAFLVGNFMGFSDGAGGRAGSWVDAIAFHFYGTDDPWTYKRTYDEYKTQQARYGFKLPIYVTESGMLIPTANQALKLQRRLITFAALGARTLIGYASDGAEVIGPFAAEWNAAAQAVAGKTITSLVKNANGSVTAMIDGEAVTF